jgi:hypothetical protein
VVFESMEVADKVVATKHTIDRREVRPGACGWQQRQARRLQPRAVLRSRC